MSPQYIGNVTSYSNTQEGKLGFRQVKQEPYQNQSALK